MSDIVATFRSYALDKDNCPRLMDEVIPTKVSLLLEAAAEVERLRAALGQWLDALNDKRAFEHHHPDNLGKEWKRLREAVDLAEDNARAALSGDKQ